MSIYSSCFSAGNFSSFQKQALFLILSVFLIILFTSFDLKFLRKNSYFILALYILGLLSLLGLLFFGTQIRGVRGWYNLGAFSFDPVPFVAIILIIVLSKYFSVRHIENKRFQPILFSGIYLLVPVLLILLQPDLGSAFLLICLWVGIIIFSGVKFRHFLVLALIFLILAGITWSFWLEDCQKARIITFLKPNIDPQGISWNSNQSKIAIGSGGFFGKGILKGSQTQYGFLPETKTDFIFSSLAEETGFLGVFVLIFFWGFLLWQIIKIAFQANS
ncbi:MAG: FtsW/RodA/SpoVE family cell cycle protein, partial [Candidatus Pacebacteria bacterium]|nr:FtsW/RodA/SpoVE family cell cycle protein [Candidatus Paceibacterota bacterium]